MADLQGAQDSHMMGLEEEEEQEGENDGLQGNNGSLLRGPPAGHHARPPRKRRLRPLGLEDGDGDLDYAKQSLAELKMIRQLLNAISLSVTNGSVASGRNAKSDKFAQELERLLPMTRAYLSQSDLYNQSNAISKLIMYVCGALDINQDRRFAMTSDSSRYNILAEKVKNASSAHRTDAVKQVLDGFMYALQQPLFDKEFYDPATGEFDFDELDRLLADIVEALGLNSEGPLDRPKLWALLGDPVFRAIVVQGSTPVDHNPADRTKINIAPDALKSTQVAVTCAMLALIMARLELFVVRRGDSKIPNAGPGLEKFKLRYECITGKLMQNLAVLNTTNFKVLNVTVEDIICYHEAGNILKHGALDNAAIVLPSTQQTPPTR